MKVCIFGNPRLVHLQRLVPGLIERGVNVHIVTHTPAEIPGATVEKLRVPPLGPGNLRRWRRREIHYLRSFFRRFDVVNVHFLHDWGLTRSDEITQDGCLVASPWGSDIVPPPGEPPPTESLLAARVSILRQAAAVTAWGPTFAGLIAELSGISAESITILPLGVDLELFQPRQSGTRRDPDVPHVGCYKGFRQVYGPTYLLEAVPLILDGLPRTRFCLVGDGPQLAECHDMARKGGFESSIEWLDHQPHRAMPDHLDGWDITVIPSVCESFGAAALESSAMRVPVVASNVGGLPETVRHGVTGLLVPPRDPERIAEAVIRLLKDATLRARMGEAGRRMVVQEYDWQGIPEDWVRMYEAARDRVAAMV